VAALPFGDEHRLEVPLGQGLGELSRSRMTVMIVMTCSYDSRYGRGSAYTPL
jgi:hypothetical protein